ncbi:MAG TPA: protoporphyrinogen oxidase [Actinomycetota bacterium]|nr:protoporphyrinogen oxidase [Actinomycetota bacterium]
MTTPHLAVVGAGITGLTAAYRLQQRGFGVTVLEGAERPGGKIWTGEIDGITVEEGPDAFLPRDERVIDLCTELGLADDLVSPAVFGAYLWHRRALRRLPPGSPYGIPRAPKAAWQEGLLSAAGAARATLERLWTKPLEGPDVSVGSFVRKRFGREVLDHLVDPLLAGVRGGRVEEMSLATAAKEIDAIARTRPSILRALRDHEPTPPVFLAPRGGMQTIVDRLAAGAGDLRINTPVRALKRDGGRVTIELDDGRVTVDGVVVALPTYRAADVLHAIAPAASPMLEDVGYASVAVITLVYPPRSFVPPPKGSGFLVASRSGLTISACTWYSTKWPHVVTDGRIVLRCVVGRAGDDVPASDEELVAATERDLARVLGLKANPLATRVSRWERSIPEYRVGHLQLVDDIERSIERAGPIVVAGAGYRGSGIPDCIASAERAVQRLLERIRASDR